MIKTIWNLIRYYFYWLTKRGRIRWEGTKQQGRWWWRQPGEKKCWKQLEVKVFEGNLKSQDQKRGNVLEAHLDLLVGGPLDRTCPLLPHVHLGHGDPHLVHLHLNHGVWKKYDTLPHASPADGPCSLCSPRWNWSSWRAGPQHSFLRSPCWWVRAISLKLSPYHDTSGEEHSLIWLTTIDPGDDLLWFYNYFVHSQKHPAQKTTASSLLDLLLLWVLLYFFIMPKDLLRLKSIFCGSNFSLYQNGVQVFSETQIFKLVFFDHIYEFTVKYIDTCDLRENENYE